MSEKTLSLTVKVWRQTGPNTSGKLESHQLDGISTDMSFLEMLDVLNEGLIHRKLEPVVFDHDCREGICGTCSLVINGVPHGPEQGTTTCQLHMRSFRDGETIIIEPFRAKAFPVIKDLTVDRSAFDRIISAGGYVSAKTGGAPDGNALPISGVVAEKAMDFAQCIGCGACVAACKNASAMLFVAAKVSHLGALPQGRPEAATRVLQMVDQMDLEGFGNCTNTEVCEAVCPKEISVEGIAGLNCEYFKSTFCSEE
jgi:succinate dehydrogenase / fumarate reductase, iron-sulfur subunit